MSWQNDIYKKIILHNLFKIPIIVEIIVKLMNTLVETTPVLEPSTTTTMFGKPTTSPLVPPTKTIARKTTTKLT